MSTKCRSAVSASSKREAKGRKASRGKPVLDKVKKPDRTFDAMMSADDAAKLLKTLGVTAKITPTSFRTSAVLLAGEYAMTTMISKGRYAFRRSAHTVACVVSSGLTLREFERRFGIAQSRLTYRGQAYAMGEPTDNESAYTVFHTFGGKFPKDKNGTIKSYTTWIRSKTADEQFRRDAGFRTAPRKSTTPLKRLGNALDLYLKKNTPKDLYDLLAKRFGIQIKIKDVA